MFGIWVMPDNRSRGSMEDFLAQLVPASQNAIWEYAGVAVNEAARLGAPCLGERQTKARLHTFLAWQNEPGHAAGTALKQKTLDATHESASAFVAWFKQLFDL
jgi:hypothetical protein